MHIFNKFGVMHTIPDDMPLPAGARKATKAEIDAWEAKDAEKKAEIKATKAASRLAHAQTVVVSAPPAPEPPAAPKASAKKESDDK